MQFRILLVALSASLALAAPTQMHVEVERGFFSDIGDAVKGAAGDVVDGAKAVGSAVETGAKDVGSAAGSVISHLANCDILKCAAALGPTAVSCGTAVAKFVQDNPEIAEVAEDAAVAAKHKRYGGDLVLAARAAAGSKAGAAGCLAGVTNTIENPPAACGQCV